MLKLLHRSEFRTTSSLSLFIDPDEYLKKKSYLKYLFSPEKSVSVKVKADGYLKENFRSRKRFFLNDDAVYRFDSAVVFDNGGIITSDNKLFTDHLLNDNVYKSVNHLKPNYLEAVKSRLSLNLLGRGEASFDNPITASKYVSQPVFLFSSLRSESYSHFVWDTLTLLVNFFELKKVKHDLKLLVLEAGDKESLPQYKKEFLSALGLDLNEVVFAGGSTVFVNELYVSDKLAINNKWVRRKSALFLNRLSSKPKVPGKMFFLDRNDYRKGVRSVTNEDNIREKLQCCGFEILTPGNMTLEEKQEKFSEASIVVSQYGGGVQNQFLFPPDTHIILLQSSAFFRYILHFTESVYNQKVRSIIGKPLGNGNNSDYFIDEDLLMDVVGNAQESL
ncbi:glycosyltransferase family 61 protein [Salinicola salarius]|uniref:glycosyltransferase family 61 protein n=1 Tax=Salinicola salarius TaxID=430457 RepID=UPI000DA254AE|nr:glycosyltransferase family 61 protein [Salinicola salarius]